MKIKLTRKQFQTLHDIVEDTAMAEFTAANMLQKMLHAILADVYKKLYVKAIEVKESYTVKLDDHEAIAFYLLYSKHTFEVTTFEGNLLNTINSRIHQHYA